MSHLLIVKMEQLLERERENSCRWLQCSLNSLVDPLVNELFHKLKTELTASLSDIHSGDVNEMMSNETRPERSHRDEMVLNHKHQHSNLSSDLVSTFNGHQSNIFEPQVLVKEEIMETTATSLQYSFDQPSTDQPSTSTEGFNQNLIKSEDGHIEDEECDCEDCLSGGFLKEEEEEDEEDGDEHELGWNAMDENISRKRQRINPEPTNEDTNRDQSLFITLALKCFQFDCSQMFSSKPLLDRHLLEEHSVDSSRCYVKDCNQSFISNHNLGLHNKEVHPHITEWPCGKCPKRFPKSLLLRDHFIRYHHEGLFQCSFPGCIFTGNNRGKLYSHYKQHQQEFVCDFDQCAQRFKNPTNLKIHQHRDHLGTAPYRCKWPACDYANYARANTLNHIRRAHFKIPTTKMKRMMMNVADPCDPKLYLEVVHELLGEEANEMGPA